MNTPQSARMTGSTQTKPGTARSKDSTAVLQLIMGWSIIYAGALIVLATGFQRMIGI